MAFVAARLHSIIPVHHGLQVNVRLWIGGLLLALCDWYVQLVVNVDFKVLELLRQIVDITSLDNLVLMLVLEECLSEVELLVNIDRFSRCELR